ncbi:MAG TPA: toxin-antitoxin system HicB family antitoxin [Terriglobia bacterium]|nr:toxin-antitoxin system HicB family antitoxin [Terriglobia bacterium]
MRESTARQGIEIGRFDVLIVCNYTSRMAKTIQIRNLSPELHRRLKARAAMEDLSLPEYLLREFRKIAEQPTLEEMQRRLRELPPFDPPISPAAVIRAGRNRR